MSNTHLTPQTTRPLVSHQPLCCGRALRASPAATGPMALGLHRHRGCHRPLPALCARRRPREGTIPSARAGRRPLPLRAVRLIAHRALRRLAAWTCAGRSATCPTVVRRAGSRRHGRSRSARFPRDDGEPILLGGHPHPEGPRTPRDRSGRLRRDPASGLRGHDSVDAVQRPGARLVARVRAWACVLRC